MAIVEHVLHKERTYALYLDIQKALYTLNRETCCWGSCIPKGLPGAYGNSCCSCYTDTKKVWSPLDVNPLNTLPSCKGYFKVARCHQSSLACMWMTSCMSHITAGLNTAYKDFLCLLADPLGFEDPLPDIPGDARTRCWLDVIAATARFLRDVCPNPSPLTSTACSLLLHPCFCGSNYYHGQSRLLTCLCPPGLSL
jgi:hypothetical protein